MPPAQGPSPTFSDPAKKSEGEQPSRSKELAQRRSVDKTVRQPTEELDKRGLLDKTVPLSTAIVLIVAPLVAFIPVAVLLPRSGPQVGREVGPSEPEAAPASSEAKTYSPPFA